MIGILTAIEIEAAAISARMERAEAGCCGPLRCRHGYLGNQEVVLALCGIGKVNAAVHTQMLIDQYGVDRLVHAGVAGAIAPSVKPLLYRAVAIPVKGRLRKNYGPSRFNLMAAGGIEELWDNRLYRSVVFLRKGGWIFGRTLTTLQPGYRL